jgi:hypothetical protein
LDRNANTLVLCFLRVVFLLCFFFGWLIGWLVGWLVVWGCRRTVQRPKTQTSTHPDIHRRKKKQPNQTQTKPNQTQPNQPNQRNPTQTNPTQPNPTQPNPTKPYKTQGGMNPNAPFFTKSPPQE